MNIEGNTSLALMQAAQGSGAKAIDAIKKVSTEDKQAKQFEEVATDFEAMFMAEMLKPMFAQIKPDPRFGGGKGEEIFSGMMVQEYGKLVAERGGIGIADAVKKELIRMQDEAEGKRQALPAATTPTENKNLDMILKEHANAQ